MFKNKEYVLTVIKEKGFTKAAERLYKKGVFNTAEQLLPIYLRLPQAERELNNKKSLKKEI